MSQPALPLPVKPVVSLILTREDLGPPVMARLSEFFGPPDLVGPWHPFTATDYYHREMGAPLGRRCAAFLHLADPARLAAWKLFTNGLEEKWALAGRRTVNLDPGYVAKERLVLATGKNFSHRIYLNDSIYSDLTLVYGQGSFQSLPWTFPDYAGEELREFFNLIRRKYMWQLQAFSPERQP